MSASIALVTGARGGIGREVTARLRAAGHRVAAVGRSVEALADVQADARIAADTTTEEGAASAIAACIDALGNTPTLLALCVGSTFIAPLHRTTAAQYCEVMRIKFDSAAYMVQAWIVAMREAHLRGSAVLCSSVVARIGVASREAIAAAKGGVEALACSAAASYATIGLRGNAVAPGMTDTPMTAGMLRADAMREAAGRQYPLGGIQTAGQVAEAMVWLLSDSASRITGQVIPVDGGLSSVRPLVE